MIPTWKKTMANGRMGLAGLVAALAFTAGLTGCRSPDVAKQPPAQNAPQRSVPRVPTPPTADQISPSSVQAILDGTSTTQTTTQPTTPPPRSTPAHRHSSASH